MELDYIKNQSNNLKIAYKFNDSSITYQELIKQSEKYANYLIRQSTGPVIIYGHKNIGMIISIFSCIFAHRTYIPIDTCTPISRIKDIIKLSKATLVITNDEININDIDCYKLKELDRFKTKEIIKEDFSDMVYIIFTSGSTGEPKGVPISRSNLENFIKWISHLKPLDSYENINILNTASLSFDLSVADLFYSMYNNHTLIGLDKTKMNDYSYIFNLISDNNINFIVMTPTFIKLCLTNIEFNVHNYPSLKCIYFCGELLDKKTVKKLIDRFPNLKIINAYGPTEATSAVTGILIDKSMLDSDDELPVGNINNAATNIEIIDEEIVLKGKSVFNGYINYQGGYYQEDNLNCYKTGDLGYIKNNKLYYIGRKDNQIKFKGYRIELGDIEKNINKINGVIDAAVISKLNCDCTTKTIKAFVVLEDNISIQYVKEQLHQLIPEYMMPKIIEKITKLPINKNGKIDRKVLEKL